MIQYKIFDYVNYVDSTKREIAKLIEKDPQIINKVLDKMLNNESDKQNHPYFIWANKYLKTEQTELNFIHDEMTAKLNVDIVKLNKDGTPEDIFQYLKTCLKNLTVFLTTTHSL
jgi:hypothetical protein